VSIESTEAAAAVTPSRPRWIVPLIIGMAGTALLAGLWAGRYLSGPSGGWADAPPELRAVLWPEPRVPADFSLTTQHGKPFGPQDLRGQWSFMFFGYLQCPDVCPTTLLALRDLRQAMLARDPDAAHYRFVFVTLDPEHDNPGAIGSYLEYFDPEFIGLGGTAEAIAKLSDSMMVMRLEDTDAQGTRLISHTSSVMVFDLDGRAVGALSPPLNPVTTLGRFEQLRRYLGD